MEINTSADSSVDRHLEYTGESINTPTGGLAGKVYKDKESGEKFYVSYREYEKHHYHELDSWAISVSILESLRNRNVGSIMIVDTDKGDVYIHDFEDYRDTDNEINHEDPQKAPNTSRAETHEDVFKGNNIERYPDEMSM